MGRLEEAEALGRVAAAGLEAAGQLASAGVVWAIVAQATGELRGLDAALEDNRIAAMVGRRSGSANRIDTDAANEAEIHILHGDYGHALGALPDVSRQHGYSSLVRARIAELQGDLSTALSAIADRASSLRPAELLRIAARARILLAEGETSDAAKGLRDWQQEFDELELMGSSPPTVLARSIAELGDALIALGTDETISRSYAFLVVPELARRFLAGWKPLDVVRGQLALRLERPLEEAEQHFRIGLEWCERERCPVEAGRCLQGLAVVAERRGDTAAAMQHLDAAGELFARYGAKLYLDQVLAKKQFLKA
jgi:hypothetical protein